MVTTQGVVSMVRENVLASPSPNPCLPTIRGHDATQSKPKCESMQSCRLLVQAIRRRGNHDTCEPSKGKRWERAFACEGREACIHAHMHRLNACRP